MCVQEVPFYVYNRGESYLDIDKEAVLNNVKELSAYGYV